MKYLLDTNILILSSVNPDIIDQFISADKDQLYLSVATVAELKSISLQNGWGLKRLQLIENILERSILIEINENMVDIYTQIDAFSQTRNPAFENYPFKTPRNMGKNDLWIAATAALLNLVLVTTDKDFDHLHQVFFEVRRPGT